MENLGSGVLVKLVEEMGGCEKATSDRKPVLLQIRSIIPVLAEDDLWPNEGFYLKVSDCTHAMFASLPQEQNDMVLCNQLQLGQLILVEKLEAAHPVPVLQGIRPLPGRFPCVGGHPEPEDVFAIDKLVDSKGDSDFVSVMENKPRGRHRSLSASKSRPIASSERKRVCRTASFDVVVTKGFKKMRPSFVEKQSDSDCTSILSSLSSSSSSTSLLGLGVKRRSWNEAEQVADSSPISAKHEMKPTARRSRSACVSPLSGLGVKRRSWNEAEQVADLSPISVKHEMKPNAWRSRSAYASPFRSVKCHSSDDNSSPKTRTTHDHLPKKAVKTSNSTRISVSSKSFDKSLDPLAIWSESNIQWNSLPPTLLKLGKDVLRHRDGAVVAAVEALQEASAAHRLLKSLSTYSEFQTDKRGEEEHQSPVVVNKFFKLQDELDQTRLILESLTTISPSSPCYTRDALVLAIDRKRNATSWIKAALAADLTPSSSPSGTATNPSHKSSKNRGNDKPKGICVVKMKHKNDGHFGLALDKECSQDWVKGSALSAAAQLERSLHDECRRWFMGSFESYLDEVDTRTVFMESENQVAEMMCEIKQVGDWLDLIADKLDSDSELEAFGRIKNKIYGVLLKHVERTAMALEHLNAMIEDQQ